MNFLFLTILQINFLLNLSKPTFLDFSCFQVGNQEAVDIAHSFCTGVDKPEPMVACKKLVDLSVSRGSVDDISVMLIKLGNYI